MGLVNYSMGRGSLVSAEEPGAAGRLRAYCGRCGMMLMDQDERCPRCRSVRVTDEAPPPSGLIHQIGMTAFTKYCGNREVV